MEGPVQTVVLSSPFICQASNQFTMGVYLQQRIGQVGQIFKITKGLAVQDVEAFDFTGCQSCDDQVLDFVRRSFCLVACLLCRCFLLLRFSGFSCFTGVVAASTQQHRCCQCQSQQFGYSLFHIVLLQLSKKSLFSLLLVSHLGNSRNLNKVKYLLYLPRYIIPKTIYDFNIFIAILSFLSLLSAKICQIDNRF